MFRTRLVSANTDKLFAFAKKKISAKIDENNIVLCHLTDYLPQNGYIKTLHDSIQAQRDSVHFSINHTVNAHKNGSWENKKFAILMPFDTAIKENEFLGGSPCDFFSKGKVKLSKGSILIRKNKQVPAGKYKIIDGKKFEEFKELTDMKIIEIPENSNIREASNHIIKRLGYQVKNTDNSFYWGTGENKFENLKKFNKLLKKNRMKPMFHFYTPNSQIEHMMELIKFRAQKQAPWQISLSPNVTLDYKKEFIKFLEYISKETKANNYPISFDISNLIEIIKTSNNPAQAVSKVKDLFKIKIAYGNKTQNIKDEFGYNLMQSILCGYKKSNKNSLEQINAYLSNPNKNNYEKFLEATQIAGIESIPLQTRIKLPKLQKYLFLEENNYINELKHLPRNKDKICINSD